MSRGVVLRFQQEAEQALRALWTSLDDLGISSLSKATHGLHVPHLSLVVGDALRNEDAISALVHLRLPAVIHFEAVGYFPQGVLHLAAVPSLELLRLQQDVFSALTAQDAIDGPWATTLPGAWSPHVTLALEVAPNRVAEAISLLAQALPISCPGTRLWIEDGDSGQGWAIHTRTADDPHVDGRKPGAWG